MKKNFEPHLILLAVAFIILICLPIGMAGCAAQKELAAKNAQYLEAVEQLTAENQDLKKELSLARAETERISSEKTILEEKAKREAQEAALPKPPQEVEKPPQKIVLTGQVLFQSGRAELAPSGKTALSKIASSLKRDYPGRYIQIAGHTDNQPITKSKRLWKSNWELSTARALSVLHFLVDECGLDPERVYVAGYGSSQPVASNNTPQGRGQNRRVEIIIEDQE